MQHAWITVFFATLVNVSLAYANPIVQEDAGSLEENAPQLTNR